MCAESNFSWRDLSYFITFLIGLITFIKTFRKKDFCELNFKTESGDEQHLYIFCTKSELYNLRITSELEGVNALKHKDINISKIKYNRDEIDGDESLFFPTIKNNEVIEIIKAHKLGKIRFDYEDKFSNAYFQTIKFDGKTDMNFKSRRFYKLSKRKATSIWKRLI